MAIRDREESARCQLLAGLLLHMAIEASVRHQPISIKEKNESIESHTICLPST